MRFHKIFKKQILLIRKFFLKKRRQMPIGHYYTNYVWKIDVIFHGKILLFLLYVHEDNSPGSIDPIFWAEVDPPLPVPEVLGIGGNCKDPGWPGCWATCWNICCSAASASRFFFCRRFWNQTLIWCSGILVSWDNFRFRSPSMYSFARKNISKWWMPEK